MVIDNTFVYAGDGRYEGLFKVEDVTEEAAALREEVAALRDVLIKVVNQDEEPEIAPGVHCSSPFDCPFLGHCAPSDTPYPVLNLPRGGELKWSLYLEGIRDLRDVPEERLKLDVHKLVVQQAKLGRAFVADDLAAQLGPDALPYPRHYLDFETVQFGIPVWEGTSPYKQQAFQFSLHVEHAGGELQHHEFIDLTGEDPSRRLAEALLGVVGRGGAGDRLQPVAGVGRSQGPCCPVPGPGSGAWSRRCASCRSAPHPAIGLLPSGHAGQLVHQGRAAYRGGDAQLR